MELLETVELVSSRFVPEELTELLELVLVAFVTVAGGRLLDSVSP